MVDTGILKRTDMSQEFWGESILANWSYLHYLVGDGPHILSSVLARYSGSQSTVSNRWTYPIARNTGEDDKRYLVHFEGALGFGYGRVRDGTFVFRAMRVIERLREDGILISPLGVERLKGVIDRVARRREYTTNFERSEKFFVKDLVEELINAHLMSRQDVNGYSVLRIVEAFNENIQPRFFGWRVYYSFLDTHDQSLADFELASSMSPPATYHDVENDWVYAHKLGMEFGHPFSLGTHFHTDAAIVLPIHEAERRFGMLFNISASHEVGERVEVTGNYQLNRITVGTYAYEADKFSRSIRHTVSGNFVYFIEDEIQLNASIGYSKSFFNYFGDYPPTYPRSSEDSGVTISFGVKYNII